MPIARRPGFATSSGTYVMPPNVIVPAGGIVAGLAVAIMNNAGAAEYRLCGALPADWADSFTGFMLLNAAAGTGAKVTVGRGSIVTPVVEGGVPLVPNTDVYLSSVPGRVTQTNLNVPTMRRLRVGSAYSTTQMVLVTDMRYVWTGA